jgi:hypothetical protein
MAEGPDVVVRTALVCGAYVPVGAHETRADPLRCYEIVDAIKIGYHDKIDGGVERIGVEFVKINVTAIRDTISSLRYRSSKRPKGLKTKVGELAPKRRESLESFVRAVGLDDEPVDLLRALKCGMKLAYVVPYGFFAVSDDAHDENACLGNARCVLWVVHDYSTPAKCRQ